VERAISISLDVHRNLQGKQIWGRDLEAVTSKIYLNPMIVVKVCVVSAQVRGESRQREVCNSGPRRIGPENKRRSGDDGQTWTFQRGQGE
jgi:hypothetical protein